MNDDIMVRQLTELYLREKTITAGLTKTVADSVPLNTVCTALYNLKTGDGIMKMKEYLSKEYPETLKCFTEADVLEGVWFFMKIIADHIHDEVSGKKGA